MNSQVNAGILVAILFAIAMYILMNKTTLGYELKACGMNRHSARYAGIRDKRNIVLSMAIAGGLAGGAAALYYLSGNTEFFWSTYQTLPAEGFNGIPVALLAVNNPIAVIFTAIFMSVLDIAGLQLTNLTAYNEYITDVIIAAIVYLSAVSLVIRMLLDGRKKKHKSGAAPADAAPVEPAQSLGDPICIRIRPSQTRTRMRPSRKEASRHELSHPTDTDLCRPAHDRGARRRVCRAQRHHQPRT
ncbi:MAG: ABC transporter permease subunit [Oscillospiraceae bacterium]